MTKFEGTRSVTLFNVASLVEAGRAQNPKVVGSNPIPATKTKLREAIVLPFLFICQEANAAEEAG